MDSLENMAVALILIQAETKKRLSAILEASGPATAFDATAATLLTGARIAMDILATVVGEDLDPDEARDEFVEALNQIMFGIEIQAIERSNK